MPPRVFTPELKAAMDEYKEKLGMWYPYVFIGGTPEQAIQDIKDRIARNDPIPLEQFDGCVS